MGIVVPARDRHDAVSGDRGRGPTQDAALSTRVGGPGGDSDSAVCARGGPGRAGATSTKHSHRQHDDVQHLRITRARTPGRHPPVEATARGSRVLKRRPGGRGRVSACSCQTRGRGGGVAARSLLTARACWTMDSPTEDAMVSESTRMWQLACGASSCAPPATAIMLPTATQACQPAATTDSHELPARQMQAAAPVAAAH